jgi:HPt (histidine-containing phosphotransfer) domain-containing protein
MPLRFHPASLLLLAATALLGLLLLLRRLRLAQRPAAEVAPPAPPAQPSAAAPLRLDAVVSRVLARVQPLPRQPGVELVCDWADESLLGRRAELLGDAQGLEQVLVDLLGQALRHTPAGQVRLRLSARPSQAAGQVPLRFVVQTDGTGAATQGDYSLPDVATARQQTPAHWDLPRAEILALGGELDIESLPGRGCSLELRLLWPRAAAAAQAAALAPPDAAEPALDTAAALPHFDGQTPLDHRALRAFADQYAAGVAAWAHWQQAPLWPELRRAAHSLQGLAATLGAPRLRALSLALERAALAGDREASTPLLPQVDAALAEVLAAITALPPLPDAHGATRPVPPGDVGELRRLLALSDSDALDWWQAHGGSAGLGAARARQVGAALAAMDFDAALAALDAPGAPA